MRCDGYKGEYPMTDNPAKAPEPCEYCGPVCYRGAEHNARVEDNPRFDDAEPEGEHTQHEGQCDYDIDGICIYCDAKRPAVPAQVAPQDEIPDALGPCGTHARLNCLECYDIEPEDLDDNGDLVVVDGQSITDSLALAELQAGAQVPTQPVSAPSPEDEYVVPPEEANYQSEMIRLCGDDFTMQAGFQRGWLVAQSALRTAREELTAMTEDRDLWRYDHEGDCPVQAALEAEREARKQAEVEQFNAGILTDAEICILSRVWHASSHDNADNWQEQHISDWLQQQIVLVRRLAKSVSGSPERLEGGK
jgi:hypothetical protein